MSEPKVELPRSFGSYSLLKLLARGGMGEIYLARTAGITGFEKYYAVKKLLKKFTHDNDVGARFVDEAKLGARLQHPNIVQVYDLGRVSDELYMATEFVDGFDLRRVLRFCHEKKKRIPLDIALFIVREVLSGLAYAHRQVDAEGQSINLIHRDISPQNVLVSFEGEVKIIDFGLAKSTQRSQETQANVLLGNFGYMSPEQARGQLLDVRTDVYSCGIVLFELVTGTKRFVEENPLKLLEMVARPTPIVPSDRVPSSPKAIDKIYVHATAQDKEQRYASAEAFRDDVTTALHRLNPRASRENLAQFLNHLFLGGQAPPTVDDNVLNKSVVLAARDLHAGAVSLGGESAADDVKNRALGQVFGDDAPQTASHPLLRTARVGDILSHDAITGEAAPASSRSASLAASSLTASSSPPMSVASLDDRSSEQPLEEMSLESAPNLDESDLNSAFESLGLTAQIKNEVRTNEGTSSSQDGAVLSVDDEPQGPTRVYDSPSWPSTSTVSEPTQATESAQKSLERRAQLDVQLQLEQQAAEAEVQRQLEAQADLQAQMQAQLEAQLEQQLQTQTKEAAKEAARQQAAQAAQAAAQAQAEQTRQQQARQLEQASRQQALAQQLDEMTQVAGPPPPRAPSRRMTAVSPPGAVDSAIVITPVAPPVAKAKKPSSPPVSVETPSIVISADLESEAVESDVGATMRNPRASGGFGDGGHHESLIIDFEQEAEPSDEELPLVEGTPQPIRPAARPVGKPVVPTVAAAKARRPSEEGPPSTMPPPTRRR